MNNDAIAAASAPASFVALEAPDRVIAEASRAAAALKDVIAQTNGAVRIGPSEHLKVEAWSTLAKFYGLVPRVTRTQYMDFGDGIRGYEAFAELVHAASGQVISSAEAMCLTDEPQWRERPVYEWRNNARVQVGVEPVPLFQLRSMAQTRAVSKVCATALRWVVVLAGYSGTPAEEMVGVAPVALDPAPTIEPPRRKTQAPPQPVGSGHGAPSAPNPTPREVNGVRQHPPGAEVIHDWINEITERTGTTKAGKPWTLYRITTQGNHVVSTFNAKLAAAAADIRDSGIRAELVVHRLDRGGLELLAIKPAPQEGTDDDADVPF